MILHTTFLVFFLLLCFLLIAAILLQTGKGGGLAGLGGGATDSAFGVRTTNVLQRFTGVCVGIFFVLVVVLAYTQRNGRRTESVLDQNLVPLQTPAEPAMGLDEPTKDASPAPVQDPAPTPGE